MELLHSWTAESNSIVVDKVDLTVNYEDFKKKYMPKLKAECIDTEWVSQAKQGTAEKVAVPMHMPGTNGKDGKKTFIFQFNQEGELFAAERLYAVDLMAMSNGNILEGLASPMYSVALETLNKRMEGILPLKRFRFLC